MADIFDCSVVFVDYLCLFPDYLDLIRILSSMGLNLKEVYQTKVPFWYVIDSLTRANFGDGQFYSPYVFLYK